MGRWLTISFTNQPHSIRVVDPKSSKSWDPGSPLPVEFQPYTDIVGIAPLHQWRDSTKM